MERQILWLEGVLGAAHFSSTPASAIASPIGPSQETYLTHDSTSIDQQHS
eukprot:m.78453 g.78453  ORF g.78453 m.78453 type:complete len:50 (+) comp10712_c0_seq1:1479-1628(+)